MDKAESIILELLVNAGTARSLLMGALQQAREGNGSAVEQALAEAKQHIQCAHALQTQLIGLDEGRGKFPVNLITVHAQDHLMDAMVIQDLAVHLVALYARHAVRASSGASGVGERGSASCDKGG
ncbi:PTS lactose/cellobiose transporter subunit IIA [Edwardsiella piscicida]|uniref:PTS lactose/cellobiose transporter subunit IIA n=1 Tax=Edwardsiella piscicida TaxID=1263550 RepID=UPI00054CB5DA|nr:PTS lactose/cellobiose transporter subunit IIA [Edwardsiella piscicida]